MGNFKRKEKRVMSSLHMLVKKTCFTIKLPREGSQLFLSYLFLPYFRAQNRRPLKKWKSLLIIFKIMITVDLTAKKAVMKKKLQLSLKLISQNQSVTWRLISQNWSITLIVVFRKKKTSTLTLILMNQLTWQLTHFMSMISFDTP